MVVFKAAIAGLTKKLAQCATLSEYMDEAVVTVKNVLRCDMTKVLELCPGGNKFVIASSRGWPTSNTRLEVPATPDTHAGFTLMQGSAVMFSDSASEERFTSLELAHENVRSGVAVIIESSRVQQYGLLLCHARQVRTWLPEELLFLQDVADLIVVAVNKMILNGVFDSLMDPVVIVNEEGEVQDGNAMSAMLDLEHCRHVRDLISCGT